jgi:hypothetical protein
MTIESVCFGLLVLVAAIVVWYLRPTGPEPRPEPPATILGKLRKLLRLEDHPE